jgi:hypothetical protein
MAQPLERTTFVDTHRGKGVFGETDVTQAFGIRQDHATISAVDFENRVRQWRQELQREREQAYTQDLAQWLHGMPVWPGPGRIPGTCAPHAPPPPMARCLE